MGQGPLPRALLRCSWHKPARYGRVCSSRGGGLPEFSHEVVRLGTVLGARAVTDGDVASAGSHQDLGNVLVQRRPPSGNHEGRRQRQPVLVERRVPRSGLESHRRARRRSFGVARSPGGGAASAARNTSSNARSSSSVARRNTGDIGATCASTSGPPRASDRHAGSKRTSDATEAGRSRTAMIAAIAPYE